MASKLWEKDFEVNKEIERFTVGRDRELDLLLAPYDVLGSMAHITMLEQIGLLSSDELTMLMRELRQIYTLCEEGKFVIEDDVEDVHSQVELLLTGDNRDGERVVRHTHCPKQPLQGCAHARIYPSASGNAVVVRTLVRGLCRVAGR